MEVGVKLIVLPLARHDAHDVNDRHSGSQAMFRILLVALLFVVVATADAAAKCLKQRDLLDYLVNSQITGESLKSGKRWIAHFEGDGDNPGGVLRYYYSDGDTATALWRAERGVIRITFNTRDVAKRQICKRRGKTYWRNVKKRRNTSVIVNVARNVDRAPNGQGGPFAGPGLETDDYSLWDIGSISEAQSLLYDRNWDVGDVDGVLGPKTRAAIRRFERQVGMAVTGEVTEELLRRLRASEPPSVWGAIAQTADGATGSSWNYKTRREAVNNAIATCQKTRSRYRNQCPNYVASTFGSHCIAIAFYQRGRRFGTSNGVADNINEARAKALIDCRTTRPRGKCKIIDLICADGRHR